MSDELKDPESIALGEAVDDEGPFDLEDKFLTDDLEDKTEEGAMPDAHAGMFHTVDPIKTQPTNKATNVCLRGPCIHYWPLLARFVAPGDEIRIKRIIQCNCHQESTLLTGQNIYHCGQWWPQFLAFVPESLRGMLRPKLKDAYVTHLKRVGYDFSWKDFRDDVFDSDRPEMFGSSGLGGKRPMKRTD